jgi:hypothetical protein
MNIVRNIARARGGRFAVSCGWVRRARPALAAFVVLLLLLAGQAPVGAQATGTWVSGVGDDVNPCSRTAPCKTFAGAISKTAAGGEIRVLDPGGFGAVTITKSMTIIAEGDLGSILNAGTSGVIMNAGVGDKVVLRGLHIQGTNGGVHGVRWVNTLNPATNGAALHIEDSTINSQSSTGVNVDLTGGSGVGAELYMKNVIVRNGADRGVRLNSTSGLIRAVLDNVQIENNVVGLEAVDRTRVLMKDSVVAGNTASGISARAAVGGAEVDLMNVAINGNGIGISSSQTAGSTVRMFGVMVTGNTTALFLNNGAQILSPGGNPGLNIITANGTHVDPSGVLPTE